MNKKYLTSSEALKIVNRGKEICYNTIDDYTVIKKNKNAFEIKVYIDGEDKLIVYNGNMQSLLKTINKNFKDQCYIKE